MFAHCFGNGGTRGGRVMRVIGMVAGGIALAVVLALVLGLLIQFLWNATLAAIFGIAAITYWQAVGLFILAKLFFSLGGHHGHHGHPGHGPKKMWGKWHHGSGACSEDVDAFHQYWEAEGKQAFEDYAERRKEQKDQEQE